MRIKKPFFLYAAHLVLVMLLSGCTANMDGKDEQGLSPHLTVNLQVPANIKLQQKTSIAIEVNKSGAPFEHAEQAEFTIWPEDHEDLALTISGVERSPGLYETEHVFSAEGIYIVQSRVASGKLEVMPSKRIAIGTSAVERLAEIEHMQDGGDSPANAGSHH